MFSEERVETLRIDEDAEVLKMASQKWKNKEASGRLERFKVKVTSVRSIKKLEI